MASTKGNRGALEGVLNHTHITSLFGERGAEVSRTQVLHLGRLLRQMWTAKLARDFPDRRFVVSLSDDDCECLQDYEITFYQE